MTCYYLDLGSASDWSCPEGNLLQPIRSTNQIWVVKRHQYEISALFSQMSFRWEFGRKFFQTKLLSSLSHKICRLLSCTRACYGTAFNSFIIAARMKTRVSSGCSKLWVCGQISMGWQFKWSLFDSTFTWCYLFFSILQTEILNFSFH